MIDPYFAPLLDIDNYLSAWLHVRKVSGWKSGTQAFGWNLLPNLRILIEQVAAGEYRPDPLSVFICRERGHERLVKALSTRDRVLQHVLCNRVLIPSLRPYLVHDNGASIKGKGTAFTRRRLVTHLSRHFREHGNQGYILLLDFRKFFDNIDHSLLLDSFARRLPSPRLMALLAVILRQYECRIDDLPPGLDLDRYVLDAAARWRVNPDWTADQPDTVRRLGRGLGVGAQLSQIAGVFYPSPIDELCKTRLRCRAYARYMDDVYVIDPSKERLREVLAAIMMRARELRLFVHPHKTQISPLCRGFTYLKTRYTLTESGRIVARPARDMFTRHRRKIRSLAGEVGRGALPLSALEALHQSWLGDKRAYDCRRALNLINRDFKEIVASCST